MVPRSKARFKRTSNRSYGRVGLEATEDQEQIALIEWAKTNPILRRYIVHPPNGGYRNKREGAKLKRMGTRKGVSDIFLPYPINGYHGLWLELKRKNRLKSKLSEEQIIWLQDMEQLGFCSKVAYGWEEAKLILETYLTPILE